MTTFNHVLVGVDLNHSHAQAVLARACQLTDPEHIEVVHVCEHLHPRYEEYASGAFANTEELDGSVVAAASADLEQLCRGFGILRHQVLDGHVPDVMRDYASEHADLLVIGSHGRHGLQTMFGSTSNAALHGTPCDTLTVHLAEGATTPAPDYRRILVAVNLEEESEVVTEHAARIAEQSRATLSLVHVFVSTRPAEQKQERAALESLGSRHGIRWDQLFSLSGTTARGIQDLAKTIYADLIVVGTHGKHGIELLRGSTANAVLHGAPCDSLSVRVGATS